MHLSSDQRRQALASLRRYVAEELDVEMGDLKAGLLLDYVTQELGPLYYNAAIGDAQVWFRDRVAVEAVHVAPEFPWWKPRRR